MFTFLSKNFFSSPAVEEILEGPGFFIYDLKHIEAKYTEWITAFPRIRPYYAMKANPDPTIVETLVRLGAGVDCASASEIVLAQARGATDIIFAQPCKTPSDIRNTKGITLTTADSESELLKLAMLHPTCEILIRIRSDDPTARHPLGSKFGCDMIEVPFLLSLAQELKLRVVGVSFHVGSASNDPQAYAHAIQNARYIYETFPEFGMKFRMLDIGGGFCGRTPLTEHVVTTITHALDVHFPKELGIEIISEPGRYFVECAGTLYVQVIGYKYDAYDSIRYYLADGVYGSFNPLLTRGDEYKITTFEVVRTPHALMHHEETTEIQSTVFGPTCDAADCLLKNVMMPRLNVGDYVAFSMIGAYGACGSTGFNGYGSSKFPVYYDLTL